MDVLCVSSVVAQLWIVSYIERVKKFAQLFKKKDELVPYDWQFLKEQCLLATRSQSAPPEMGASFLGNLDFERLEASGDDAEDVVIAIHMALTVCGPSSFSLIQTQEYLLRVGELLRADITASEAAAGLREIERCIRKK